MRARWLLMLAVLVPAAGVVAQPVPLDEALEEQAQATYHKSHRLRMEGKLAEAVAAGEELLALCRQLYPPERFPKGHPHLGLAFNNLGALLLERGDLAQAEPHFRDALAVARKLYPSDRHPDGHRQIAGCLNNLGAVLRDRGELARAEAHCREALAMRRRLYPPDRFPDGHSELTQSLNNLGILLQLRGELAAAEPLLREALDIKRKLYPEERFPDGHPDLASSLNNLGILLQARGELARAEPFYRDALAMRRKLYPRERYPAGHADVVRSLNAVGFLLNARGQTARAEPLLREAVAVCREVYSTEDYPIGHPVFANSLHNLGAVHFARGEATRAEPLLREAADMVQRMTEALLAGSSEAEALNHLAQLPPTRDVYLSVTAALPDSAPAAHASSWVARGTVARWLAGRRLALASGDPETRALARRLTEARRELAALLLSPATPADSGRARVRTLNDLKERLEKQLARRLPAFGRQLESARHTPDDLRRALPDDAAYVALTSYSRYEHDRDGEDGEGRTPSYVAFVLSRAQGVRRVELGAARPIEQDWADWQQALTEGRADERAAADRLARRTWAKLREHLPPGTRTVWLTPDGVLARVPWGALPGGKPGTVVLEELALAVVPHGQLLLEQQTDRQAATSVLLVVGGVDYAQAPTGQPHAPPDHTGSKADARGPEPADLPRAPDSKLSWPALPATVREQQRVLRLAEEAGIRSAVSLSSRKADTARLLAELPRARWAHLATHGFFAGPKFRSALRLDEADYKRGRRGERVGIGARNPLALSGLVLAGAGLQGDEARADGGILTAEAIAGLPLDRLELAVLSACDTGLGEVAGGEGVLGLQRAFHLAGARDVVASLWKVDDEATAALMSLFYHNLWREKLSPIEALRQAQLTLYRDPKRIPALARDRGPDFTKAARLPAPAAGGARAHPRLWAGFVLSGPGVHAAHEGK
jgi:CHAT domain-containing protein/Tfp pilus assembly protein PilF